MSRARLGQARTAVDRRRFAGGAAVRAIGERGGAASFPHASPLQWGAALDLNLRGPMLATQLVLEPMRRRGGGAVVNVASTGERHAVRVAPAPAQSCHRRG